MRQHGLNRGKTAVLFCCPCRRHVRRGGKLKIEAFPHECPLGLLCQPDSVMGPIYHLAIADNPRLNTRIARGSALWQTLYNSRTSTERFNSFVRCKGALGSRPYRRSHLFLMNILCQALHRHAQVWVKKLFGGKLSASAAGVVDRLLLLAKQRNQPADPLAA